MNPLTDIVVAGAGPAGIAAAVRARAAGASVIVIDDNSAPGGQIWRGADQRHPGRQASKWLARFREASAEVITGGQIVAADPVGRSVLVETERGARELRYGSLILATGAREIFLPFPGWTMPGVTGVGGLQALVKSGWPVAGKRIVVAGSGPLLLAAASYFRQRGAEVRVIAEQAHRRALASFAIRLASSPGKLLQAIRLRAALTGVPYRSGCWVEAAEGDGQVRRVHLRQGSKTWTEECEYAAVAYGLFPNTELAALCGCRVDAAGVAVNDWQETTVPGVFAAGECTGIGGVEMSLAEGEIAGYASAGDRARARRVSPARERGRRFARALSAAFALRREVTRLARPDTIVCRCEDVTLEQLQAFSAFRPAKLHARCGMGACQARICGTAAHFLFGWRNESIRPPVFPASIAALALDTTTGTEEAAAKR